MIEIFGGEFYWVALIFISVFVILMWTVSSIREKVFKNQKDKTLHIAISLFLCVFISLFFNKFTELWAPLIATACTLVIGALKELRDYVTKKGTADMNDFIADIVGSVAGGLLMFFMFLLFIEK